MQKILIDASIIALAAVVWIQMMVSPGNLLDFVAKWFSRIYGEKHPKVQFVLFQCEKCFAGQLALWWWIISISDFGFRISWLYHGFMLVILSIFMARVIGGALVKYF